MKARFTPMKMSTRLIHFAVALLVGGFTLVARQAAFAQASTTADVVYGQRGSFTASGTNDPNGVSASSYNFPNGLSSTAMAMSTSADSGNSRILFFTAGQYHRHAGLRAVGQLHYKHAEQRRDQRQQLNGADMTWPWIAAATST